MKRLLLLAMVVGCVKKGDGTLGQDDAQSMGAAIGDEVEDGAAGFGSVSAGAALDASCVTLSGDTADPDQDSIPNNAMLTFDCSSTGLGITTTLTGTESVMDGEPNSIAWAFDANVELHAAITSTGGASVTTDRTGTIRASQGNVAGPFAFERTLDVTTVLTGERGNKVTLGVENGYTVIYTPMVTWTPGSVVVTGTVQAQGSWNATIGSNSADVTLATPVPLTLAPSCETRITAGEVVGTWTGGGQTRTVDVKWTACGVRTVTYSAS